MAKKNTNLVLLIAVAFLVAGLIYAFTRAEQKHAPSTNQNARSGSQESNMELIAEPDASMGYDNEFDDGATEVPPPDMGMGEGIWNGPRHSTEFF